QLRKPLATAGGMGAAWVDAKAKGIAALGDLVGSARLPGDHPGALAHLRAGLDGAEGDGVEVGAFGGDGGVQAGAGDRSGEDSHGAPSRAPRGEEWARRAGGRILSDGGPEGGGREAR